MSKRLVRVSAAVLSLSLLAAACGGDDDDTSDDTSSEEADEPAADDGDDTADEPAGDDTADEPAGDDDTGDEPAADGEALPLEGEVEVAAGTTLNLSECPDDWSATQGVDGDEIRLGMTLPQSGPLAAFGQIGEGIQMYLDYLNDTDPINGQEATLVLKDDAYEAGRAVANVEEMIDTEDIFAFVHFIGTPVNVATRPITGDNCIPQLFNSSGFPLWGDPANWPWTIGNILDYSTETEIWCQTVVDELGEGATVAALYMNNDFGTTYKNTVDTSEACASLDVVAEQTHDPAADSIQNEMTTLLASEAQVFFAGTTAAYCPQTVGAVAASEWRPQYYMSYTCNNLSSFFTPVQDAAGLLAAEGSGVRMTNLNKVCGDPQYADDPAIQEVEQILADYGDVTCADGSYSTGVLYGHIVEDVLRSAAAMPGGLNRVNLMAAVWNLDETDDLVLGGTQRTDGVNDAYIQEAAQVQEVQVVDGSLTFAGIGDLVDLEGQAGSYAG
ncbi:MAG: ABC transporter substrate-binding protein [Ilumatobacter fluminis]|uniref:ABC transporter substrate-binding protein n=1 Tax=Ilumatobacter fluminis TaxID=467091 RepID=UPI0032EE6AE6